MVHVSSRRRRLIIINNGEKIMENRTTLKLKPEAIKPDLNYKKTSKELASKNANRPRGLSECKCSL